MELKEMTKLKWPDGWGRTLLERVMERTFKVALSANVGVTNASTT